MKRVDFALFHGPSVYDFRRMTLMYGPISDVIPSTPVFEMYPLGFVSIAAYLERKGYNVRIVNLAVRMLKDRSFDVEKFIEHLHPAAFGVDLHWLVHAHGSLEVARTIKKHHPDTPVVMGGLSATYYHRDILGQYPWIDYVVRGDSVEKPLLRLLRCLEAGKTPSEIPNVSWRDSSGRVRENELAYVPESLDDYSLDYEYMFRSVIKHRDLLCHLPFEGWMEYPYTAVITCKGCTYNCATCGGSCAAFKRFYGRSKVALKSPKMLAEEIKTIEEYVRGPVFMVGDLRQGGVPYAEEVLKTIKHEAVDNPITFEIFTAAPQGYLRQLANASSTFSLQISPESHDEDVRRIQGRVFSNRSLEKTVEDALRLGCEKMDLFFMVGLPSQSAQSVVDTVRYCSKLLNKHGGGGKLHTFMAPLAPFLDPASLAFENPSRYGYKLFFKELEEHRQALLNPSWKYYLNYETAWMTRDEICNVTYESAKLMVNLKLKHGLIGLSEAEAILSRVELAESVTSKIDQILRSTKNPYERRRRFQSLSGEVEEANKSLLCPKKEIEVPCEARIKKASIIKLLSSMVGG